MDVRVDVKHNQPVQVPPFYSHEHSAETTTRHKSTGTMQQKTLPTFERQKADWGKKKQFKIRAEEIRPVLLLLVLLVIIMESFTSGNVSVCSMVGPVIKNP